MMPSRPFSFLYLIAENHQHTNFGLFWLRRRRWQQKVDFLIPIERPSFDLLTFHFCILRVTIKRFISFGEKWNCSLGITTCCKRVNDLGEDLDSALTLCFEIFVFRVYWRIMEYDVFAIMAIMSLILSKMIVSLRFSFEAGYQSTIKRFHSSKYIASWLIFQMQHKIIFKGHS